MKNRLTRRQQEIYEYLRDAEADFCRPPTLTELCDALGLKSKGSLHKQIQALVKAGLVEPMHNQRRGIQLTDAARKDPDRLPLLGFIAAGQPIEVVAQQEHIAVPGSLRTERPCFVLQVRGDSMIEEGILDGDFIVVEQREHARNGEIVVALIDGSEATLKRIEQKPDTVVLHPANARMRSMRFATERVHVQGILVGQMRRY